MRITFVLPGFIDAPMGGVRVVVGYANRLARRGHAVTLVYPLRTDGPILTNWLKSALKVMSKTKPELYYRPHPDVNSLVVKKIVPKYIPLGDAVVAVGYQTAEGVATLPPEHGRKFYLLQSLETYFRQRRKVLLTYHLPLQKIAISRWISAELAKQGETAWGPLGNAIDPQEFFLQSDIEREYDVMFHYHHRRIKGARIALKVLKRLKKERPNLRAVCIAPRRPLHRILAWCELVIRPDGATLRHLYNSTKVLLFTSRWEGWGLPPMEALACGCAVVATANRGVSEYLTDQESALLCPIDDVKMLTTQIERLLDSAPLRTDLVKRGRETVQRYSWDDCTERFIGYLEGGSN